MKLNKPKPIRDLVGDFVSGSPLQRSLELAKTPPPLVTEPEPEPELNPRIMKQVNFDMPEPEHYRLKRLVDSMPNMSMRKFILEAIKEKSERLS